ncbi:hypothetical protein ABEB36_002942 [Hypothenemus hampei]|uniref:Uncharacterized protein n=1 Tax=Hypothenemus hampei TaxID=57062 RepID=A0ABD1F867_HYPHA
MWGDPSFRRDWVDLWVLDLPLRTQHLNIAYNASTQRYCSMKLESTNNIYRKTVNIESIDMVKLFQGTSVKHVKIKKKRKMTAKQCHKGTEVIKLKFSGDFMEFPS